MERTDSIIAMGTEGENVTVDSTYEDALATTVINKVEIMMLIFKIESLPVLIDCDEKEK